VSDPKLGVGAGRRCQWRAEGAAHRRSVPLFRSLFLPTARSEWLSHTFNGCVCVVEWVEGLHLQNRAVLLAERSVQLAQHLQQLALTEGQNRAAQLEDVLIQNGFPAAHAPLAATSVVLTIALLLALLALWILSKSLVPVLRKVLSAFAWTVGLVFLVIRSVLW
jgi:hypothetical protein